MRQSGGWQEQSFEVIGSMSVCRTCNRMAVTERGHQQLDMQTCDPAAHRLNQRSNERARRQAQKGRRRGTWQWPGRHRTGRPARPSAGPFRSLLLIRTTKVKFLE